MTIYEGLDVSDKTTHICVVDSEGVVLRRDVVASDPDVLAKWFDRHCPDLEQVVLETGPLSTFLYHGLKDRNVPVERICGRHANGGSRPFAGSCASANGAIDPGDHDRPARVSGLTWPCWRISANSIA